MKASIQTKLCALGLWALIALLPGCGLFGWLDRSDDYKQSEAAKPLEVPPELSEPIKDQSMHVPETKRPAGAPAREASEPPDLDNSPLPEVPDVELPRDDSGVPFLAVEDTVGSTWRRTGLALERAGFAIESRDEARRLYTVRYVPPREKEEEGGFFSRLFGGDDDEETQAGGGVYRVSVMGAGERESQIVVLDASGDPQSGASANRILSLLADRLLN